MATREPIPGIPVRRHSKVLFNSVCSFICHCGNLVDPYEKCAFLEDELVCADCWRNGE